MTPLTVRDATHADLAVLLEQMRQLDTYLGATYSLYPDTQDAAAGVLRSLMDQHLFLVASDGDRVIGSIAGVLTPHFMNVRLLVLCEVLWWIDEAHRSTQLGARAGLALVDAYNAYGEANAQWVVMTLQNHSTGGDRFLAKRGFRPQENNYLREVVR